MAGRRFRVMRQAGFGRDSHNSQSYVKMTDMANLTLVYGMRLLPEGEVTEIHDATLKLANGHEAHVTMHVLEGSREQIETQLKQSLDAFFDFYPEI
jgi:hypothetical protein